LGSVPPRVGICPPAWNSQSLTGWQSAAPGGDPLLPAWKPEAPTVRQQGVPARGYRVQRTFRCRGCSQGVSPASAGGWLRVESHSDVVVTWRWACEAIKTANCLRTYLAAVFAVQRSRPYAMSDTAEGETCGRPPARVATRTDGETPGDGFVGRGRKSLPFGGDNYIVGDYAVKLKNFFHQTLLTGRRVYELGLGKAEGKSAEI
jgi:hypothetical protein